MKKVTGEELGAIITLVCCLGLALLALLAGCRSGTSDGLAPTTQAESPEKMTWEYAIGDKVLHKSGVLGVVTDMDFSAMAGFGSYATGEGQWDGKPRQCYLIRVQGENSLACVWVSVLELEDAPDG